jgi:hypothetical protein
MSSLREKYTWDTGQIEMLDRVANELQPPLRVLDLSLPDATLLDHFLLNAFCPTGPGGGIDPHCSPFGGRGGQDPLSPPVKREHIKALTPGDQKELNQLVTRRAELNKKVKDGTASEGHKAELAQVKARFLELATLARKRFQGEKEEVKVEKKKKKVEKTEEKKVEKKKVEKTMTIKTTLAPPQIPKVPEHEVAENLRKVDAVIAATAKKYEPGDSPTRGEIVDRLRTVEREMMKGGYYEGKLGLTSMMDEMRGTGATMKGKKLKEVERILDESSRDVGSITAHGMAHPEKMRSMVIDGVRLTYPDTPAGKKQAAESISRILSDTAYGVFDVIPEKLWGANKEVIFSSQANKDDPHWQMVHNDPSHVSAATGGDGRIVVYGGEAMGPSTFAHEAGHNLATKEWGIPSPSPVSKFGRLQEVGNVEEVDASGNRSLRARVVNAVSDYGRNNRAEDFAEACKLFVTSPQKLKQEHPEKYAVILEMLQGTG